MAKLTNKTMNIYDESLKKKASELVKDAKLAYANGTGVPSSVQALVNEAKNIQSSVPVSGTLAAASPDYARGLVMNPASNALASGLGMNGLNKNLTNQAIQNSSSTDNARNTAMNPLANPIAQKASVNDLKAAINPGAVNYYLENYGSSAVPKVGDVQNGTTGGSVSDSFIKNLTKGMAETALGEAKKNTQNVVNASNNGNTSGGNASGGNVYNYVAPSYQPSQAVIDAQNLLNDQLAKLNASRGATTDRLNALISQLENRDAFSYDPNSDILYQQYLATMKNNGLRAMKDTMGQAAALTGGYGSSYATQAANGAYNQYLSQANDNLPQFYDMARSNYDADTQALLNRINLAQNQDEIEYNRALDAIKLQQANLDRENDNYWKQQSLNLDLANQALNQQKYNDSRSDAEREWALAQQKYNDSRSDAEREWNFQLQQMGYNPDGTVNPDYMATASANASNASSGKLTTTSENDNAYKYLANFDMNGLSRYLDSLQASGKDINALDDFLYENSPIIRKTKDGWVSSGDKVSVDGSESTKIRNLMKEYGLKGSEMQKALIKELDNAAIGYELNLYELMLKLAD